jgi:hypothetical protein
MIFGRKPRLMEFFVETHMQNDDRQKRVQQLIDIRAQKFMVCLISTIYFLNSLFLHNYDFFSRNI